MPILEREYELDPAPEVALPEVDEATARRDLRDQIAKLEAQLGAAVTDVHVPESREPVDILAAVDVLHGRAAPADADETLGVVDGMVQGMDQVLLIRRDQLAGGRHDRLFARFGTHAGIVLSAAVRS